MQQKEPRLRENWFEQQYHKLRNWVEENVGLEKPEDTLNDSTEEKHKAILDEFTSIIKNDLSEGKRLSESEDADLNKRIASLIKSENITAPRLADELTKMEDMVESNTDSIVNLKNLDELQSRFKSNDEMEDENKNIEDNVVGDRQVNRWQMVNLTKGSNPETPEVNKAPLVDPNVVDLKTIMSGLKSVPHMVLDGAQKVANIIRPEGKDITVGDAQQTPTVEAEDKGNDTVGCSLEKDSDEETIYLQPPGYGYGYRESKNQDKLHLPTLDEIFHPHSKKKSHELSQFEELLHPQESRSGAKDKPVTGLPKLIQDLEHLTLPPIPGLKPHHKHHPSTLPPPPQYVDHNIPIPNNPNPPIENPNFNPNMPLNNNPFFNNNPPNDPNFNPNFNPNLNPNQQFMEPPPPFIPPQGFPNEFQSRHAHGHGHGGRHNIVGAQHMQNNPNFRHDLGHFGKIVPAELHDLNIHSRDVSEQMKGHKMYFVGDGIKLPLHMNKHDDGTLHLSVDMHKLCKCNQTNCKNEPHFLDTKITTDQDVPNALDDDDVNLGMAAPTSKELASSLDDKDIFKRSPDIQQKLNVYDEQFDEVLPIRNMHRENLENHINAFNEDVNRYYDNEISDKIPERKNNDEGDDDVVQQRVGLLTNVLSWMKDLVMEDAK
ncbi:PREDICTED: uncharacterized protein LOC108558842 [Nicrophorus vespilloides]|uniref:Uncharacterized protein LOC108558842 n=1 Tax=Nicrophorus vespilloides TaxID=110193 RepID=A0ABM1M9W1_NICVS|nr:PREDICTED: uncharacterized protein LOC108558842 [Nicrophorus vespilloides]